MFLYIFLGLGLEIWLMTVVSSAGGTKASTGGTALVFKISKT